MEIDEKSGAFCLTYNCKLYIIYKHFEDYCEEN